MHLTTSRYNEDQRSALLTAREGLERIDPARRREVERAVAPYLSFREEVARFQSAHFSGVCTGRCFTDGTSACCGREGILTFFADVVLNLMVSGRGAADLLLTALAQDRGGSGCVYLSRGGCLWGLKPIVCEMFLCDEAKEKVLAPEPALERRWEELRSREKDFTLPVRPVLFDALEELFIEAGHDSPLMYFHKSPGLVRLKKKHGVVSSI